MFIKYIRLKIVEQNNIEIINNYKKILLLLEKYIM